MHTWMIRFVLSVGGVLVLCSSGIGQQVTFSSVSPDVRKLLAEQGGTVKVWVLFADKGLNSAGARQRMMDRVQTGYDRRALARRLQRRTAPGLVDEHDLPIAAEYQAAVEATGGRIVVCSRWLNAASVMATAEQIDAIASLPFVKKIQPVGRGKRVLPKGVEEMAPPANEAPLRMGALNYGPSQSQLSQINVIALHNLGYTGAGIVLAILDTGFYKDHETVHPERIIAEWDFVNGDGNTQNQPGDPAGQHDHGTGTLSASAGYKDGQLYGAGFGASLILCKTEDTSREVPAEEDFFVAGLEFAESHGADVVTSSLGYIDWYTQAQLDGQTAVTTIGVNIATANGLFCCNAAGNEGPSSPSLIAPADAFQVITVGAVDSLGSLAGFSSRGPTADGRVKPEVLARGVSTWLANTGGPTSYGYGSGTSFATPLVAGAVVCLVQAHPDWTVNQLRAALFYTSDYYTAHGSYDATFARGYGVINALAAHQYQFIPGDFDFDRDVDDADLDHLVACVTGPGVGPPSNPCRNANLDGDDDVDQEDFGILQRCFGGTNRAVSPNCAGL